MARYFVRSRSFVEDDLFESDTPMIPPISVPEHEAVNTGLIDAKGEEIWRLPNPIGFGRMEEW